MERKAIDSSVELNEKRPANYIKQQGVKAVLSLADFEDSQLCAELRRRGWSGELRCSKILSV